MYESYNECKRLVSFLQTPFVLNEPRDHTVVHFRSVRDSQIPVVYSVDLLWGVYRTLVVFEEVNGHSFGSKRLPGRYHCRCLERQSPKEKGVTRPGTGGEPVVSRLLSQYLVTFHVLI